MNVFELQKRLISDYSDYIRSFIHIKDDRIREKVDAELKAGLLWPDPLIQLNPSFEAGETVDELVDKKILHSECSKIFRKGKEKDPAGSVLRLHRHQADAIKIAQKDENYVLTTGTGSGKSLAYIVPIVNYVLKEGSGKGIRAIVIYPMNALANSQENELRKFLCYGYPDQKSPVTFARYTGQETDETRQQIIATPPDILLTNYVMLELLFTRPHERALIQSAKNLKFLVLDELHTYRGRQGADVAMLVRRAKNIFNSPNIQFVGTSATLAGPGTYVEQKQQVAVLASAIFGDIVKPENVIGETLKRSTPEKQISSATFIKALTEKLRKKDPPPTEYSDFTNDPLSIWIESNFGIETEADTGRLIRSTPRSITGDDGAAKRLSELTGVSFEDCVSAIEKHLLASYGSEPNPDTGFPVFAFRLHQFISRGDAVYASPEAEDARYLTVNGQQYVPGDRGRILLPVVFCRSCGQEYYCVEMAQDEETRMRKFLPRELSERYCDEDSEAAFLYVNTKDPWPEETLEVFERIPDDWLEEHRGVRRVKAARKDYLPRTVRVGANGIENPKGQEMQLVPAPFRFCLHCGVSYGFRQNADFAKLTSLATEGRSTATTILGLSAIRYLKKDKTLSERARKLLSFTDNRQDASLQAGHFNDFIETGLLRSALYKAILTEGENGVRYDEMVQKVFNALDLPLELYATDPSVRFQALEETKKALRAVLGYRLYRDLKRGWRITAPNLEQCGLLEIKYLSLEQLCAAQDVWQGKHPSLETATPETRLNVAKTFLDYMRRELCIRVEYLDTIKQEQIQQQSSQRLITPWAIDDNEKMEHAAILYPRALRRGQDYGGDVYLSPRGGFGQYLRRSSTFSDYRHPISLDETQNIFKQLLDALKEAGLVEVVAEAKSEDEVNGYQVPASALVWLAGKGEKPFIDPIRIPRTPESGGRTNPFFIEFYRSIAVEGKGLEAREHTAQVQYELRLQREEAFKEAKLPILFCSPTMELGVDIAELNAVNMRNVPPTPANYAQRSGRAGRSGQPAIVFTYCSSFSPHDQYFFKRPEDMVSGIVTPPRLDLTNEDLIRSHMHAVWLSETGQDLGKSLIEILDVDSSNSVLDLRIKQAVLDSLNSSTARKNALKRAGQVLESLSRDLEGADWFTDHWLDEVLTQITLQFDRACNRWRELYRSAYNQREAQHRIVADHTRSQEDRQRATRLRAEAESQLRILTEAKYAIESDFYSYRYFASEGFLPGYNFPRLPLSAFIPARRKAKGRDEFLSRPRFLAVSEFGPRAIVYHEGARYRINRVILPVEEQAEGGDIVTTNIKQCHSCGYVHPITAGDGLDLCERCSAPLESTLRDLFRLQNVATKRADRINSDEEERLRLGYEIKTGIRFIDHGHGLSCRTAVIRQGEKDIANLIYGHAATIWRINLGWTRRADKNQCGFVLDVERGYWAKNQQDAEDDEQDPVAQRTKRVIPYVEDRKNCLLFAPVENMEESKIISLQSALKNAIQVEYQLEDSELAAVSLPSRENPRVILFYEAAEGGAGVLRRLLDDPQAIPNIAKRALSISHFDPVSGNDLKRAPRSREDCEAACYDCLMSYTNQMDHGLLDRKKIKEDLLCLGKATVLAAPAPVSRAEHLQCLLRQCQSKLEKEWLQYLETNALRLPSKAQKFVEVCQTRPDFVYEDSATVIYVDGPPHKYPERQERDKTQQNCLEDHGYTVIRFKNNDDWETIVARYPNLFGKIKNRA
jgi:ATP-dependent helicase YprA (DUF1998 family)/very-short-patch-repair endonuclease